MTNRLGANRRGAATSVATESLERFVLATRPEYPRRAVYLALAGDIVLLLAFVGITLLGDSVPRMFDLDGEKNIPTWYASAKLLAVAALLALVALNADRRDRLTQLVLLMPVALFLFLSIDEVASIHEMLGGNIDSMVTDTPDRAEMVLHITGYWMFVLGPMLAAAMVAMGIAYHRLVRPAATIMRLAALGAGVFLLGATVVEIGRNFVEHPLALMLQVTLEEGMELIGVSLILAAALHLAAEKLRQSVPKPSRASPQRQSAPASP
jgi:hypothetical protein